MGTVSVGRSRDQNAPGIPASSDGWADGRTVGGGAAVVGSVACNDTRAGVWTTGNGSALDVQLGMLLKDLCYLDGRDTEQSLIRDVRPWYGKVGFVGAVYRDVRARTARVRGGRIRVGRASGAVLAHIT
jgi:hypothetical protein